MKPNFVVEVMNACNVSVASKLFSAPTIPGNATVLIRILTRADLLSDEALLYQMEQAQQQGRSDKYTSAAVIAMDLRNAESIKVKTLKPLMNVLAGGAKLAGTSTAVVCGAPNAGKSSFILPLTRDRTMQVRKKKSFHLPKISSTAGWTLSTKKHALQVAGDTTVTLIDTPGLRPRMNSVDVETQALLIACGAMEYTKGMMTDELEEMIVELVLKALNRHGSFAKATAMPYVQALGLNEPSKDPMEFLEAFQATNNTHTGTGLILQLVQQCRAGKLGGLLYESDASTPQDLPASDNELPVNRNSPIVCMNNEAMRLIDIGTGMVEAPAPSPVMKTSPKTTNKPTARNGNDAQPHRADGHKERSSTPNATTVSLKRNDSKQERNVVLLPEHQRDFRCMKCASFIKQTGNGVNDVCGTRHNRCISWDEHDIRSYYSRMVEAFGGHESQHKRYLMRDSLACTLASKRKLRSRRQVYKKLGKTLGGYPVPDDARPLRFRSDQPVPLKIKCTSRAKTSCRARAENDKVIGYQK